MELYIQGDLLIARVSDTPSQTDGTQEDVVLLEGEGHNVHVLEKGVVQDAKEVDTQWLREAINELNFDALHVISLPEETVVRHVPVGDETDGHNHNDLVLPAGEYITRQQRETFPDVGIVQVYD